MAKNTAIPFKGTRDISGDDMRFRLTILDAIRHSFELFGFEPLETPIIERKETLYGKYGEEAENLLFTLDAPHDDGGLRYDHTVPLARFAAANWQELPKPYKRYAIGPVFRADNTQAGRYRQFIQCDFDTLGSGSATIDAEIVAINHSILSKIGFTDQYQIQMNDRRLLNAMVREMGFDTEDEVGGVLRSWDKLDKTAPDEVFEYAVRIMKKYGHDRTKMESMYKKTTDLLLTLVEKSTDEVIKTLRDNFKSDPVHKALDNIQQLVELIRGLGVPEGRFQLNPLLARGLGYYTGPIFETVVKQAGIGSITGGGRFDNLIETMGGPSVPASGSSFGIDRLIVVMETLGLRPKSSQTTSVFVTLFDQSDSELTAASLLAAEKLREADIAVEVYSGDIAKLGKQIGLASKKQIPIAIVIGPEEKSSNEVSVKILATGEERRVVLDDLVKTVKSIE